ncbi:MAG: ABC transporter permease, partial [Myxococcales bacterium]|nr:ABC transporter permease [Myxococcales bacterium]
MPLFASMLWDVLTAAGGTVALGLIVVIALGINAMTLLFAGSAVVALEGFARAARRTRSVVGFGALWAIVLGAAVVVAHSAELADVSPRDRALAWPLAMFGCAAGVAFASVVTRFTLQRVRPARLATTVLFLLGLGAAAVLGGSGRVLPAAAPALVAGGAALMLARRRRRRAQPEPGEAERMLRALAAALALGIALALLLPDPNLFMARAGGVLLAGLTLVVIFGLVPIAAAGIIDTRLSAEWFIAVRYLLAKRRQTFISVITGICVIGIAAGVWLIITVLSVMNGFERTWRDEIIGNRAHFTVHSGLGPFDGYREVLDRVAGTPGVVAASPYLDAEGMVRGDAGEIMAVRVRGVDPARVGQVTDLRDDLVAGSLESLDPARSEGPEPSILIGSQLAASLGVGVGDSILLISPFGGPRTPLGPAPRLVR